MAIATGTAIAISAGVGAAATVGASAIGANQAKQAAKGNRNEANRLRGEIEMLEEQRRKEVPVIAPYGGAEDLSDMITDLSDQLSNPFENLGVATRAAEIQMEQTDLALANTLDLLAATGASAGGATALARAAAQSKRGVAASLEKQELSNERARAAGEANLQRAKMAEAVRVQAGLFGEAQRQQEMDAADIRYEFDKKDSRFLEQLDRKQAQLTGQETQAAANRQAGRDMMSAGVQGAIGMIGGGITAAAGMPSTASAGDSAGSITGSITGGNQYNNFGSDFGMNILKETNEIMRTTNLTGN